MIVDDCGAIVNVSSVERPAAAIPEDRSNAAFKAAVIHFTRSLAFQVVANGVRVNAIGPERHRIAAGALRKWLSAEEQAQIRRHWVPVGRMGPARGQARVILFLASDLSGFRPPVTRSRPTVATAPRGGWLPLVTQPDRDMDESTRCAPSARVVSSAARLQTGRR